MIKPDIFSLGLRYTGWESAGLMVKMSHRRSHDFLWGALFICPIAIAYIMGQIIKSICVCQSVSVSVCISVRLRALSRSHFLIDFHQNWHRRDNPKKEERVR